MKNPLPTLKEETHNLPGVSVHAGFPNPAAESPLENPNFNKLLIRHPAATYCMAISGHAWEDRGVYDGDIVVIDRALSARGRDLVVWWQDDNFAISHANQLPENRSHWGAVSAIIHLTR
jgi:DNA polymerase V